MDDGRHDRFAAISCALGAAVVSLVSNGMQINRNNIIYELERIKGASADIRVKIINTAAAEILRRRG